MPKLYAGYTYVIACVSLQDNDDDEVTPGYTAPKKVDLKTIQELDADDESLVRYKQSLLGQTSDVKGEFPFDQASLPVDR